MLAAFEQRGPGTDAERRAARRLAKELTAAGHKVRTEPFWCRPNWALAHAWHVTLALAGSLLSVSQPIIGAVLLGAALLSVLADGLAGISPGRRLTPERASQNVLTSTAHETDPHKTRLIITANYDAGRTALVYRDSLRRTAAWLRRRAGPLALGWLSWLSIAITWSLAIAVIRATERHPPHSLGAIQLPPTVALVLAFALLLEAGAAAYGPAANDNASGTAVAIALANALRAGPPRNLAVELVLQGAGNGHEIGIRRYLRTHRTELKTSNTIVLGIAPCHNGAKVQHWLSDGRLIPLRYSRTLRELCASLDADADAGYRGRGATPAFPARARGLPAIAIGCPDANADPIDETALSRALEVALVLVNAIDASLLSAETAPTPA